MSEKEQESQKEEEYDPSEHHHRPGDGSWWLYDGYNIPLALVCDVCEKYKLAEYRPDIMERYEADEPIEEDY